MEKRGLPIRKDKTIEFSVAEKWMDDNAERDAQFREPRAREKEAQAAVEKVNGHGLLDRRSKSAGERYFLARAEKEEALASKAALDLRERAGELVPRAVMQKAAFKSYRAVRDAFLGIPDRVAAQCAAEGDARKVHGILTGEIRQVLGTIGRGEEGQADEGREDKAA